MKFIIFLFFSGTLAVTYGEPLHKVERKNDILFATPDGVDLLLDLYLPEGREKPPLVMYIHGGGWVNGDRKKCKIAWLAAHGYAIASVEYRLSHEALFPAQIHDCKGALRWLRANEEKYGYDATSVVVTGSSAGGHLAALMTTSGGISDLEGTTGGNLDQSSSVQAGIDYYGPSDFVHRSETQPSKTDEPDGSVYALLGGPVKENLESARAASPITYVGEGDPPLLIIHGKKDKTVFVDQSERLKAAYDAAGLDAAIHFEPEKGHGWSPPTPEEKQAVLDFLKSGRG